jgi:CheY-like chemotaxis protein
VELTLRAFKKAHFTNQVHVVNDGARALDYVFYRGEYARRPTAEHPQLILLDLNLPKVSGLEVLRRIKADKRTWQIPVAIITASQDFAEIGECRRLGAEQYIAKPIDLQRLSLITPQLNLDWALIESAGAKSRNKITYKPDVASAARPGS